ncbi:MAG: TRAP transporter small permease [Bacillota bacterium]
MKKYVEWIVLIQEYCTAASLIAMSLLVFVQVFGRKVVFVSIPWSEEMARFLMIWLVYLGLSAASFRDGHISLTVFKKVGKYSLEPLRQFLSTFLGLAVSMTMIYLLTDFMVKLKIMGQVSAVLRWPMWAVLIPVQAGIVLLFLSYVFQSVEMLNDRIKGRKGPGSPAACGPGERMEDTAR